MPKFIPWQRSDGTIVVTVPCDPPLVEETDAEFLVRMRDASGLKPRPHETTEDFQLRVIKEPNKPKRLPGEGDAEYIMRLVLLTTLTMIPAETLDEYQERLVLATGFTKRMAETEDEYHDRIAARALECDASIADPVLDGATRLPAIDAEQLPDRRFRQSWRADKSAVAIDLPAAKAQILEEVRAERNKLLDKSDMTKLKLDEIGSAKEKQDVLTYRQALRDLPAVAATAIDAAKSVDELLAVKPAMPVLADVAADDVTVVADAVVVKP